MYKRKTPAGPAFDLRSVNSALSTAGVAPNLAYFHLVNEVRSRFAFEQSFIRFDDVKPEHMRSTAEGGRFVKEAHLRWNDECKSKNLHAKKSMDKAFPDAAGRCYFSNDNEAATACMLDHNDLARWRDRQVRFLRRIAKQALAYDVQLRIAHPPSPTVKRINQHYNLGLMAVLLDAMSYPDLSLVNDMLQGVMVCGNLTTLDTGVYRKLPAHIEPLESFLRRFEAWEDTHDDWLRADADRVEARVRALRQKAAAGDTLACQDLDTMRRVFDSTLDEGQKGLMGPAMTVHQLRAQFTVNGKLTARVLPRFGVLQGWTEKRCRACKPLPAPCAHCVGHRMRKLRCCDDAKKSGTNDFTRMPETTVFPTFEFSARAAAAVYNRQPGRELILGLDDLAAAYRRVPTSQPRFTVVSCWDFHRDAVSYFQVYGLNFGLTSAPLLFCRVPQFYAPSLAASLQQCAMRMSTIICASTLLMLLITVIPTTTVCPSFGAAARNAP